MQHLILSDSAIDKASYERYQQHLDTIQDKLPPDLYRMLRFPEEAYRSGRTMYDSNVVEWRDELTDEQGRTVTQIRVLSPQHDEEYLFTLHDPTTMATSQGAVFRLGDMYCLEVSWSADSKFCLSFVYITRTELQISCNAFSFHIQARAEAAGSSQAVE